MTREEALEWFKDRKKMNLDDKCQQAEDMAIKALEQEPILDRDCEHCSRTYGTLGCCTTVSNKWVYSCKEGQREYLLDKISTELLSAKEKWWYGVENDCFMKLSDVLQIINDKISEVQGEKYYGNFKGSQDDDSGWDGE